MIITFKTFKMNAFNCIFELRLGNYPSRWFNYIQQILQSTFMQYSLMRCAAELRKSNAISDSQLYSSCQEEVSRTTSVSLQRKNCKVKIHDLLSWGSSLNSAKKKRKSAIGKDKNQDFCRGVTIVGRIIFSKHIILPATNIFLLVHYFWISKHCPLLEMHIHTPLGILDSASKKS